MRVQAHPDPGDADTIAALVLPGADPLPHAPPEAKPAPGSVAVTHAEGRRWVFAGATPDPEGLRRGAAVAAERAQEAGARVLALQPPDPDTAGPLVEGALLALRTFTRYQRSPKPAVETLVVLGEDSAEVARAELEAGAQNRARDLADTPPNDMTPTVLAARARELEGVSADVLAGAEIAAAGLGAFAGVARGSEEPAQLITLRYDGAGGGERLGLVGKAVTFDSGGYSIKTAAGMRDMKFDMAGGGAVIEAVGALAALRVPLDVVAVIGATENMVSGRGQRVGDVVRAGDGTTIEVTNTDAEGRLVLADCLWWARERGAERLLDVATLTGGILGALGHTYAGLMANDDAWAGAVLAAGTATGEESWRLPLHPDFSEAMRSRVADLRNATPERRPGPSQAAAFLSHFAGDVPWAHLDMVGPAWDNGRPYTRRGASGWGVRLCVEVARRLAATS